MYVLLHYGYNEDYHPTLEFETFYGAAHSPEPLRRLASEAEGYMVPAVCQLKTLDFSEHRANSDAKNWHWYIKKVELEI